MILALLAACWPGYSTAQKPSSAAPTQEGKQFATVWRIRGDVSATGNSTGGERKLREGDRVAVGERVRADSLAEAVLKTDDAGVVAVRPNTEFVVDRFSAADKPTDGLTVKLVTGSLRLISGWIARTNRSGTNIVTASATIGIRGTDHEPYVLSAELATATANKEGTYDKVNRGGTTMRVGANKLDIDAGKVGFARAADPSVGRALMTILLPVILDKVPNFYVAGEFDAELDKYSQTADKESLDQLKQRRKGGASASADTCLPNPIATTWLAQLDRAIARNDAKSIIEMFAPEANAKATVLSAEGKATTVIITRDELAQSTIAAMKGLKNYKQRRVWTEGKLDPSALGTCERISLGSVVIEQGLQSGKPFRFESMEEYVLERRGGKWIAIKAETTQQ